MYVKALMQSRNTTFISKKDDPYKEILLYLKIT